MQGVGPKGDEEVGDIGQKERGKGPGQGGVKVEVEAGAVLHS